MPRFVPLFFFLLAILSCTLAQSTCDIAFSSDFREITSGTCVGLGLGWGDITSSTECMNNAARALSIGCSGSADSGPPGCQLSNDQCIWFNSNTASSTAPSASLRSVCALNSAVVTVDTDGNAIFPASVKTLTRQDVQPCINKIRSVTFEAGSQLTTIDENTFSMSDLNGIILPASLTSIGTDAFRSCSRLNSVDFESGSQLTTIGSQAFWQCTSLKEIVIPKGVTVLGQGAFGGTDSLATATFDCGNAMNVDLDGSFDYNDNPDVIIYLPSSVAYGSGNFRIKHTTCPDYESYEMIVVIILCAMLAIWFACFYFLRHNKEVNFRLRETVGLMLLITIPALDTFSDLAYLLLSPFRDRGYIYAGVVFFLIPNLVFIYILHKRHILFRPKLVLAFPKSAESLLIAAPYITINAPTLILKLFVGVLLYATHVFSMLPVRKWWICWWTGEVYDSKNMQPVDIEILKSSIWSNIFCKTVPMFFVQLSNGILPNMSISIVPALSFVTSMASLVRGIWCLTVNFYNKYNYGDRFMKLPLLKINSCDWVCALFGSHALIGVERGGDHESRGAVALTSQHFQRSREPIWVHTAEMKSDDPLVAKVIGMMAHFDERQSKLAAGLYNTSMASKDAHSVVREIKDVDFEIGEAKRPMKKTIGILSEIQSKLKNISTKVAATAERRGGSLQAAIVLLLAMLPTTEAVCQITPTAGHVEIPNTWTSVSSSAFAYCSDLNSLSFESGSQLKTIDENAFISSGLNAVVLPASLVSISMSAFSDCTSLESVAFQSGCSIEEIHPAAFQGCSSLTSFDISECAQLTFIESHVFYECVSLPTVTMGCMNTGLDLHYTAFGVPDTNEEVKRLKAMKLSFPRTLFETVKFSSEYFDSVEVISCIPDSTVSTVLIVIGVVWFLCFLFVRNGKGNFGKAEACGLIAFTIMPAFDTYTDLAYLLTAKFSYFGPFGKNGLYKAALATFMLPNLAFFYLLYQRCILFRPKLYFIELPGKDETWSYMGGLIAFPLLLLNAPLILLKLLVGVYLYATKVLCVGAICNSWFRWWTGHNDFDINQPVDTEILNESLYSELLVESFPQFIIQLINNLMLNPNIAEWGTVPLISFFMTAGTLSTGIWRFIYFKFIQEKHLGNVPVKFKVFGYKIFKSKHTYFQETIERNRQLTRLMMVDSIVDGNEEGNINDNQKQKSADDYLDDIDSSDDEDTYEHKTKNDQDSKKDTAALKPLIAKITKAMFLLTKERYEMALELRRIKIIQNETKTGLDEAETSLTRTSFGLQATITDLDSMNSTWEDTKKHVLNIQKAVQMLHGDRAAAVATELTFMNPELSSQEVGVKKLPEEKENASSTCSKTSVLKELELLSVAELIVENDDDVEADEKHEDPVIKHIYGKLKKYQHLQQKMEATMNATTSGCNNIRSNTQHMLDEFQETMSNVHKTISTINTIKTGVELAKREVQTASDLVARLQ